MRKKTRHWKADSHVLTELGTDSQLGVSSAHLSTLATMLEAGTQSSGLQEMYTETVSSHAESPAKWGRRNLEKRQLLQLIAALSTDLKLGKKILRNSEICSPRNSMHIHG
ncbi:hypothetical protein ElyMa_000424100 [Elysia marginata]|uniref:Uncharacterized protein n=1 Tax=Elysia marginata TaxID=1093978 RepID=A0AAV4FMM3_9GAST|nr:hypothetical protein ElyMa_000424100 [Elysia marginata]